MNGKLVYNKFEGIKIPGNYFIDLNEIIIKKEYLRIP